MPHRVNPRPYAKVLPVTVEITTRPKTTIKAPTNLINIFNIIVILYMFLLMPNAILALIYLLHDYKIEK